MKRHVVSAVQLGVNYNSIHKVYQDLETDGLINSGRGRRSTIAQNAVKANMPDYLAYNDWCAQDIACDAEAFGRGVTKREKTILMSFLEAREEYLDAFWNEVDVAFGSFDVYALHGLGLSVSQIDALSSRIWGSWLRQRIAV